jgi:hypothetical protein
VDLWNIHTFILREEKGSWGSEIPVGIDATTGVLWEVQDHDRLDLIVYQVRRFRQWMRDRGERDKELIITEYGILMPDTEGFGFDAPRVSAFMLNTFDYFMNATDPELGYPADGNRLVQRWAWYSLNDKLFEGYPSRSHLFDPGTRQLTTLGYAFKNYTQALSCAPYVDLVPNSLNFTSLPPVAPVGSPVQVTLAATVRNAGNADIENVSVQFWAGDPTYPVGAAQVIPVLAARALATVSVDWADVPPGAYTIGVRVDPDDLVAESDENNNQFSRTLFVGHLGALLPVVARNPEAWWNGSHSPLGDEAYREPGGSRPALDGPLGDLGTRAFPLCDGGGADHPGGLPGNACPRPDVGTR